MHPRSFDTSWLAALILATASPLPAGAQVYDLLVSSRSTNSVIRYDGQTGDFIDEFVEPGVGGLMRTQEVALGPDGGLYVTGRGTPAILRIDRRNGDLIGNFTTGYVLEDATKMTFGPDGMVYVSQWGQTKTAVARFDATTGAFVDEATPPLNLGMQHAWDADGRLYVANFGSQDVQRFDAGGNFIDVFTSGKSLQGPVNLWFDPSGDLLVVDWTAGTVERFDGTTGVFKSTFIAGFTNVEGWAIGPDGMLYLADWAENQIRRFDPNTGDFIDVFARGGGLLQPNSLLFVERLPDFDVTTSPSVITVPSGGTGTVDVTVTALGGLAFGDPIAFACTGQTGGVACSFADTPLSPGTTSATTTLTLTAPTLAGGSMLGLLLLTGIVIAAVTTPPLTGRRAWRPARLVALALVAGCGGDPVMPPNQPRTEVVTLLVRGDANGLVRSASLTVTITAQ